MTDSKDQKKGTGYLFFMDHGCVTSCNLFYKKRAKSTATHFWLPFNHSPAVKVGSHRTLVGGNRSSWKYAALTRGTVKEIGSIVVLVSL